MASASACKPPIGSSTKPKASVLVRPQSATKTLSAVHTAELAQRRAMSIRQRNNSADSAASSKENVASGSDAKFHAKPVNRKLLASPTVGVNKHKPASPTRPIPFSFSTNERALQRKNSETKVDGNHGRADLEKCFKALPLPSKERQNQNGQPAEDPVHVRMAKMEAELKEKRRKLAEKMEEERNRPKFQASLMPDFNRPVFCPILATIKPTELAPFALSTDRRAEERKPYEEYLKSKEEEKAKIMRQREMERHRKEEEEMRRLRAATVHQPLPIRKAKPFVIKHEPKITVPETPYSHVDQRLQYRNVNNQ